MEPSFDLGLECLKRKVNQLLKLEGLNKVLNESKEDNVDTIYDEEYERDEYEEYSDDSDIQVAGAQKFVPSIPSILNIIYNRPVGRNVYYGEKKVLTPLSKDVKVAMIYDLNKILPSGNLEELDDIFKKVERGSYFYNTPGYVFAPNTNKTWTRSNSKLIVVVFDVDRSVEFFKEVFTKKEDSKPMEPNSGISIRVKGNDILRIETKNLNINKIMKINNDNSFEELKSVSDFKDINKERTKDSITLIINKCMSLCTKFKE